MYAIIATRHWYGPRETKELVRRADGRLLKIPTTRDAGYWIREQESKTYQLSHNESSPPDYEPTEIDSVTCQRLMEANGLTA
jgi:hypothetical protein